VAGREREGGGRGDEVDEEEAGCDLHECGEEGGAYETCDVVSEVDQATEYPSLNVHNQGFSRAKTHSGASAEDRTRRVDKHTDQTMQNLHPRKRLHSPRVSLQVIIHLPTR